MKFRKLISGLIFAAGCMLLFVSLLAYALSYLSSPQLALLKDSFFTQSDNSAVQLINRLMQLVMVQQWQTAAAGILVTAAGILLMNHFSRSRKAMQSSAEDQETTSDADCGSASMTEPVPSGPNPFAVAVYNQHMQELAEQKPAFELPSSPILELNPIEDVPSLPLEEAPEDEAPYFSDRFTMESRAVQAEISAPSQSGSWMLMRAPAEADDLPVLPEMPLEPEPAPVPEKLPDELPATSLETFAAFDIPAPEPVLAKPSSVSSTRIRSTMGRHGNRKSNFTAGHS